jgi:hypothetical protein
MSILISIIAIAICGIIYRYMSTLIFAAFFCPMVDKMGDES